MCVTQTVLDITRTVFGRHRDGYIFPMQLSVKSMPNAFAGIIQPVQTPDQFILFSSHTKRILSATQDTMRIMGVEGSEFEENDVSLTEFFDEDALEKLMHAAEDAAYASNRNAARAPKRLSVCPGR